MFSKKTKKELIRGRITPLKGNGMTASLQYVFRMPYQKGFEAYLAIGPSYFSYLNRRGMCIVPEVGLQYQYSKARTRFIAQIGGAYEQKIINAKALPICSFSLMSSIGLSFSF